MKTFNAGGPWCQVRGVPSNARGLQGLLLCVTLASGTSEPGRRVGGRPAGAPMGCGGAQKTRPHSRSRPGAAAPAPPALRAVKGEGPASPGAAGLSLPASLARCR